MNLLRNLIRVLAQGKMVQQKVTHFQSFISIGDETEFDSVFLKESSK
jgi:hypothetical protein